MGGFQSEEFRFSQNAHQTSILTRLYKISFAQVVLFSFAYAALEYFSGGGVDLGDGLNNWFGPICVSNTGCLSPYHVFIMFTLSSILTMQPMAYSMFFSKSKQNRSLLTSGAMFSAASILGFIFLEDFFYNVIQLFLEGHWITHVWIPLPYPLNLYWRFDGYLVYEWYILFPAVAVALYSAAFRIARRL